MMITEVMKISEPPYTNRGVTRQKEDLTALIDWCQITVKGVDVFIIIEDVQEWKFPKQRQNRYGY